MAAAKIRCEISGSVPRRRHRRLTLPEKVPQEVGDQLRLDIVKHIIEVKIAEREAEADASSRKEKKQKLLALIEKNRMKTFVARAWI